MAPNVDQQQATAPPSQEGSGGMFDTIARRYDLLNRVLSLGLDGSWRRKAVEALELRTQAEVLDLATGTGDLAFAIAASSADVHVVGVDPSEGMLSVAAEKCDRLGLGNRVSFEPGDAQDLHRLEANRFDACCIAFGIRNVPNRGQALGEMARVVRPGGRIVILELSVPRSGFLAWGARFQVNYVVPWIGGLLSGRDAYQHLRDSMHAFPDSESFARDIEAAGLDVESVDVLAPGVCSLFVARVPVQTERV